MPTATGQMRMGSRFRGFDLLALVVALLTVALALVKLSATSEGLHVERLTVGQTPVTVFAPTTPRCPAAVRSSSWRTALPDPSS